MGGESNRATSHALKECGHRYFERTRTPLPGTCAHRVCTLCDHAEVQLARTYQWVTMDEYERMMSADRRA